MDASQNGHVDVVDRLLDAQASVDQANKNGATSLYIAAEKGHVDVVNRLLDAKATVDQARNDGFTPLQAAAYQNNLDVCVRVIAAGADVSLTVAGKTAAAWAENQGHSECARICAMSRPALQAYAQDRAGPQGRLWRSFFAGGPN
jgi:ankyrin repeat protein